MKLILTTLLSCVCVSFGWSQTITYDLKDLLPPGKHAARSFTFERTNSSPEEQNHKDPKLVLKVTGTDDLEIIQKGDIISFHGYGKLQDLDSLQINVAANRSVFRGQAMPYDTASIKEPIQDLKRMYVYSWTSEGFLVQKERPATDKSEMSRYFISIGRYAPTGETYLRVGAIKVEKGKSVFNVRAAVLIK